MTKSFSFRFALWAALLLIALVLFSKRTAAQNEGEAETQLPARYLGNNLQFAEANMPKAQEESKKPPNCNELLAEPPLSDLHERVSKGYGGDIDDRKLGALLLGLNCEESEITSYMEKQGFQFLSRRTWPESQWGGGHDGFRYNKNVSFCTPPRGLLNRLFVRQCGIIARFYFLDSTITHISAGGTK